MRKILILGGNGFLGQHVVEALKEENYEVFSLSRHEGTDIRILEDFSRRLKEINPDTIINCAAHVGGIHYVAQYAGDVIDDNMRIVLNIYKGVTAVCPLAKIINPISNCSYSGEANTHYEPDWEKGPVHDSVLAYASVRRMIYAVSECYRKQYGVKTVNWLIANAYGPGDYTDPNKVHALNGIIIRMIKAQRTQEKQFEIWGSGKPTREWVYIKDVAKILVKSINEIEEQVYPINFAQNKAYSIAEIAKIAAEILNYNVEFSFNTKYADGAPFKILDDRKFREKYPDFKFTSLEEGIKNTIHYYKSII
ncbi:MAG: NAD-dependent epimerase/dehydratase family protein [bacterium]|nr:NAD-dependent epimerase/dehydratase family protein [bacterium]